MAKKIVQLKAKVFSVSLPTNRWVAVSGAYTQTITVSGSTTKSKIDLQPTSSVISVLINSKCTGMYVENNNGNLTVYAVSNKPNVDITVQATICEVEP